MENIEFDARLLKSIKIAIKRSDLQTNDSSNKTIATIIKRDLLEPESLNINFCSTNRLPMFSRCDIKENTVKLEDDIVLGQKSSEIFPSFYNRAPSLDSECVSRSRESNNRRSKRDRSESREKCSSPRGQHKSRRRNSRLVRSRESNNRRSKRDRSESREKSSSPRGQHKSRRRNRRRVRSKSRSQDRRRSRNDYNPNARYQRSPERRRSPPQEYIPNAQYTGYYEPTYGEFPSPEYMYNISYDQMMMPNIQYVAVQLPPQDESSM